MHCLRGCDAFGDHDGPILIDPAHQGEQTRTWAPGTNRFCPSGAIVWTFRTAPVPSTMAVIRLPRRSRRNAHQRRRDPFGVR